MKTYISGRDVIAVGACESGILKWCQSVGICMDAEIAVETAIALAKSECYLNWIEKASGRNSDSESNGDGTGVGYGNGFREGSGYGDGYDDGYGGYNYGYGYRHGDGYGYGDGSGYGDGFGYGD